MILRFYIRLALFCTLTVLVCELVFRFLFPAQDYPLKKTLPEYGIQVFDRDVPQGIFTYGRFAEKRAKWRVNNCGWNSEFDYFPNRHTKPLIALLGDSYVEGVYIEPAAKLQEQLADALHDSAEIYSFGLSAAGLAQELQMARYVKKEFDPDVYLFLLIDGDLEESLIDINPVSTYHRFSVEGDTVIEIPAKPFYVSPVRRVLRDWALRRYVISNAEWYFTSGSIFQIHKPPKPIVPVEKYSRIVRYFVSEMKAIAGDKPVVFIVDGDRNSIYERKKPRQVLLTTLVEQYSRQFQIPFLDLTETYQKRYRIDGKKFNTDYNFHLNAYGNRVIAERIADKLREEKVLSGE